MQKKFTVPACFVVGLLAFLGLTTTSASAAPITAVELLEDPEPFELFNRDLKRTLSDSTGFFLVINDDPSILASNAPDNDFGVYNTESVGYRHNLTWLNPAAGTFLNATLTILAFGADNGNDSVVTETLNIGNLVADGGGPFNEGFTTTIFSSAAPAVLSVLFADGYLNIVVNKGGTRFIPVDALSVYSSKLEVTYEPANVPEPASMILLGSGLLGLAAKRKKAA